MPASQWRIYLARQHFLTSTCAYWQTFKLAFNDGELTEEQRNTAILFGVKEEHIHVVLPILPKYTVSSLMGYLNGKLSTGRFQRYEKLGKRYCGRHYSIITFHKSCLF
jgi:REP element-mobilizing transposase RayT|tara:strand:+ start:760 stop:1083 length:324 start_codon:yes stop_codon:yes gene_type:complete